MSERRFEVRYFGIGPHAASVHEIWPFLRIADFVAVGMFNNVGLFRAMPKTWISVDPETRVSELDANDPAALLIYENIINKTDAHTATAREAHEGWERIRHRLSMAMMMRGLMSADHAMMQAMSAVQNLVEEHRE